MKVLYILPHSFISGASIQLRTLLNNIKIPIESTTFVCAYDGVLGADIASKSRLISITQKTPDERHDILKRYLSNNFDILHVIESWDGYQLLPYFKGKKIVTLYGDYRRPDKYFKKRITKLKDSTPLLVTDNPRNLNLFPDVHYIRTGVHTPDPSYFAPRRDQVLWVGRNSDEKRLSTFFKIAGLMPDTDFVAVVAGPMPMDDPPENLTLYHNVIRPIELEYLYKSSSVYVNTSKHEGTPQAMIESMSCGCVPIGPNTGGIPDLIGRNGIVLNTSSRDKDEGDNVDLFRTAIHRVLYGDTPWDRDAVMDSVKDYTIDNMMNDWEAIYNE